MDQFAGMLALIAADRLGRLQGAEPLRPRREDAADGGREIAISAAICLPVWR